MNTFVSLQKDVALVSLIGPVEILRQAGIDKATYANFTPVRRRLGDLPRRRPSPAPASPTTRSPGNAARTGATTIA